MAKKNTQTFSPNVRRLAGATAVMLAFSGVSSLAMAQTAPSTYFGSVSGADSAAAPAPNVGGFQSKNDTILQRDSGNAFMGKGQNKKGVANLATIREVIDQTSNRTLERIEAVSTTIRNETNKNITEVTDQVLQTVQASLGDSAPIIIERSIPTNGAFEEILTMPYDGHIVATIVGAGQGGNSGYQYTSGQGGMAGALIFEQKYQNIPAGTKVAVRIGRGGVGSSSAAAGAAGEPSQLRIGAATYTAIGGTSGSRQSFGAGIWYDQASLASCESGPLFLRSGFNWSAGGFVCKGTYGKRPTSSSGVVFQKATGGLPLSAGSFNFGSATLADYAPRAAGTFGAGGVGGTATMSYVSNYAPAATKSLADETQYTPGSNGGDGYIKIRAYNPDALITAERLNDFVVAGGASDARISIEAAFKALSATSKVLYGSSQSCMMTGNAGYWESTGYGTLRVTATLNSTDKNAVNFVSDCVGPHGHIAPLQNISVPLSTVGRFSQKIGGGSMVCGQIGIDSQFDLHVNPVIAENVVKNLELSIRQVALLRYAGFCDTTGE